MKNNNPLRIGIVGGSLGGLTAARVLTDAGHHVEVFERSHKPLTGQGAGIVLHPATVRYLTQAGDAGLADISIPASYVRYLDRDGAILRDLPCCYRFSSYFALYQALLRGLPADRYRLGREVSGVSQDAHSVELEFADGARAAGYDLVVFADGIHSTGRRLLLPEIGVDYAGYVAWRGTIEKARLTGESFAKLADAIAYYVGAGTHMLTYPIPGADVACGHDLTNWVWYWNVAEGEPLATLMTDRRGRRQGLSVGPGAVPADQVETLRRRALAELPPPLAEMVSRTTDPFLQAIVDIAVPRMRFGRICLMGDAAFAARPHVAAGTAKAAEDGWKLAQALDSTSDLDRALAAWEAGQLVLGRSVLTRTMAAGDSIQKHGRWQPGEPLPFGLYREGDSAL